VAAIICFTSDFGLGDTWVGVCHAVMLGRCADAAVVDLDHSVRAYDVRKAAAVAASGAFQLPEAVHLVVVDPGVGGSRADLCIITSSGCRLVGPDNGVLLPAAERLGGVGAAYSLDASVLSAADVAATFHARDVLAPAAAALACGADPASLGRPLDLSTLAPGPFGDSRVEGDYVVGEVVDVDRFGSLRFNMTRQRLAELGDELNRLEIGLGHYVLSVPFARTFSNVPVGDPVAVIDSSGWLALAVNQGDAADRFGVSPGAHVRVRRLDQ
jgi:S-adenosyl-L-methionine hydrolase (adenosine-forming)